MLLCVSIGHIWQDVRVASDQAPFFIRGTAPVRPYVHSRQVVRRPGKKTAHSRTQTASLVKADVTVACLYAIPVKTEPLHILRVRDRTVLVR